jgi:hypothetical protein
LPFVTARAAGDSYTIRALRLALADVLSDSSLATVREQLLLDDIDFAPDPNFLAVRNLELQAAALGYTTLR